MTFLSPKVGQSYLRLLVIFVVVTAAAWTWVKLSHARQERLAELSGSTLIYSNQDSFGTQLTAQLQGSGVQALAIESPNVGTKIASVIGSKKPYRTTFGGEAQESQGALFRVIPGALLLLGLEWRLLQ